MAPARQSARPVERPARTCFSDLDRYATSGHSHRRGLSLRTPADAPGNTGLRGGGARARALAPRRLVDPRHIAGEPQARPRGRNDRYSQQLFRSRSRAWRCAVCAPRRNLPAAGEIKAGFPIPVLSQDPSPVRRQSIMQSSSRREAVLRAGACCERRLAPPSDSPARSRHGASSPAPISRMTAPIPPHVKLERFRPDLPDASRRRRLSVSQAGYNTVCDILRARCRSILVPFAAGGETEQSLRAAKLAGIEPCSRHSRSCARLANASSRRSEQAQKRDPRPPHRLDLEGARHTAEILRRTCAVRRGRSA